MSTNQDDKLPPGLEAVMQSAQELSGPDPDHAGVLAAQESSEDAIEQTHAQLSELIDFVDTLGRPMLDAKAPRWSRAYGPQQMAAIKHAGARLFVTLGWNVGDMLAGYGPHLAFLGACLGPALPLLLTPAEAPKPTPAPAQAPVATNSEVVFYGDNDGRVL